MEFASEALQHFTRARATRVLAAEVRAAEVQAATPPELYSTLDLLRWAGECEGLELEQATRAVAAKVPACDPALLELLCWAGECEAVGLEKDQLTKANERQAASELLLWEGECEEIELEAAESTAASEKDYDAVMDSLHSQSATNSLKSTEVTPDSPLCEEYWGDCEDFVLQSALPTEERSDLEAELQFRQLKSVEYTKEGDEASTSASTRPSTRSSTRPSTQPSTRPSTPPFSPRRSVCWPPSLLSQSECEEIVPKLAQTSVSGCTAALRTPPGSAANVA